MVKRIVVVFNLSFRTNIFIITYQPGPTNEDEGGDGEDETTAGGALVVFLLLWSFFLLLPSLYLFLWHGTKSPSVLLNNFYHLCHTVFLSFFTICWLDPRSNTLCQCGEQPFQKVETSPRSPSTSTKNPSLRLSRPSLPPRTTTRSKQKLIVGRERAACWRTG